MALEFSVQSGVLHVNQRLQYWGTDRSLCANDDFSTEKYTGDTSPLFEEILNRLRCDDSGVNSIVVRPFTLRIPGLSDHQILRLAVEAELTVETVKAKAATAEVLAQIFGDDLF